MLRLSIGGWWVSKNTGSRALANDGVPSNSISCWPRTDETGDIYIYEPAESHQFATL